MQVFDLWCLLTFEQNFHLVYARITRRSQASFTRSEWIAKRSSVAMYPAISEDPQSILYNYIDEDRIKLVDRPCEAARSLVLGVSESDIRASNAACKFSIYMYTALVARRNFQYFVADTNSETAWLRKRKWPIRRKSLGDQIQVLCSIDKYI